jgi:hypothetical protein
VDPVDPDPDSDPDPQHWFFYTMKKNKKNVNKFNIMYSSVSDPDLTGATGYLI